MADLRIAFNNFQELINKYPNSPYAPDAAQRMIYIYNQFAEKPVHEVPLTGTSSVRICSRSQPRQMGISVLSA